jgi:peptide-methionine (S)-S-oxide reductase
MSDSGNLVETAILGGGCFWCLEAAFQEIAGVEKVVSGYAGGKTIDPTYYQVVSGTTGHAEVVEVTFLPDVISYGDILDIFWAIHDPTTKNRQGNDVGPQYRSIILYQSSDQKRLAVSSGEAVQKLWPDPITTEIEPLVRFYSAEPEQQNYYRSHPEQAYCQLVINPKLAKLRSKFQARLKA